MSNQSNKPCIICRRSTNRIGGRKVRRSFLLTPAFFEEHTFILDYIKYIDNSTEINELDRICRPCFQRGTYWNRQRSAHQESSDSDTAEIKREQEDNDQDVAQDDEELKVEPNIGDHDDQANPQSRTIEIPGYLRLPNNSTAEILQEENDQDVAQDGQDLKVEPNIGDHDDQANPQSRTIEIPEHLRLPNNSTAEILQEDNDQDVAQEDQELKVEPNIGDHDDQANPQSRTIEIPGYLRLPNNSTICIVNNCTDQNLHRINVAVRRDLLIKNNLYIPRGTRICNVHLESNIWEQLRDIARHTFSTFNSTQTKDMLTLQKTVITEYLNVQK